MISKHFIKILPENRFRAQKTSNQMIALPVFKINFIHIISVNDIPLHSFQDAIFIFDSNLHHSPTSCAYFLNWLPDFSHHIPQNCHNLHQYFKKMCTIIFLVNKVRKNRLKLVIQEMLKGQENQTGQENQMTPCSPSQTQAFTTMVCGQR